MTENQTPSDQKPAGMTPRKFAVSAGLGLLVVIWAYWDPWSQSSTLGEIVHAWEHTPVYSHGYLIPLFAIGLLWLRRDKLQLSKCSPSWWGVVLIGVAVLLRLAGAHYFYEWFDFISILPMLGGVCLLVGGGTAFRWAVPSIAFLFFMLPLPFRIEVGLRTPLQRIGTIGSCYALQTLGLPAYAEGNQIHGVTEGPLGVEEACSGLGMMMVFFALTTAVVYLATNRPIWERVLVLLSAAPIAVAANLIRITTTGVLYAWGFDRAAEILHDHLAAFLMMPIALGLMWLEFWFFSKLVITEEIRPISAQFALKSADAAADRKMPVTSGSGS